MNDQNNTSETANRPDEEESRGRIPEVGTGSRRSFLRNGALTSLAVGIGLGGTGTVSASDDDNGESGGELQRPVRADEPTEPVQELLDTLAEEEVPHINELSTEAARELFSAFFTGPTEEEVGRVENMDVEGPNGPIPIRVYWPEETRFDDPLPVTLYMHGGGWVLGGLDTHDSVARSLCNDSESIVVSIDYRKGPENPFPAAVEDCWAVAQWAAESDCSIGGDPSRMAVTGESAGGNMATVLTFLAKNDDSVNFVHQLPIYPVTDLSGSWVGQLPETFSIVSSEDEQQLDRRYLVPEDLVWFAERYLPYEYAAQNLYVSPLLAREERLSGLPPATIVTTGFGPLGDQGYLYARQLQEAGVSVDVTHYPEMIHDFFNMEYLNNPYPDIPTAGEAKEMAGETLREAFQQD